MPILSCPYHPRNLLLKQSHPSTILPTVLGKSNTENFTRSTIELRDGAIIKIDWLKSQNERLLVLLPGLGGHSRRIYMSRTAQAAIQKDWDVLVLNYRGFNGSTNPVPKTYHGGAIDDLHEILTMTIRNYPNYKYLSLGGFSLGGNIVLNYLGNHRLKKPELIRSAICFSVPCDFTSSSPLLAIGFNHWVYGKRFVKSLKEQVEAQRNLFEGLYDQKLFNQIETLRDFDDVFTSRVNGFMDGEDYYRRVSSLQYLDQIEVPVLLVNAENDPMLSKRCFPREIAKQSKFVHLESPEFGGHVGFANDLSFQRFYYADRVKTWLTQTSNSC